MAACRRAGVDLRYHTRVTGIETAAGRATGVAIGDDRIEADTVVLAGGGHNLELATLAGVELDGVAHAHSGDRDRALAPLDRPWPRADRPRRLSAPDRARRSHGRLRGGRAASRGHHLGPADNGRPGAPFRHDVPGARQRPRAAPVVGHPARFERLRPTARPAPRPRRAMAQGRLALRASPARRPVARCSPRRSPPARSTTACAPSRSTASAAARPSPNARWLCSNRTLRGRPLGRFELPPRRARRAIFRKMVTSKTRTLTNDTAAGEAAPMSPSGPDCVRTFAA